MEYHQLHFISKKRLGFNKRLAVELWSPLYGTVRMQSRQAQRRSTFCSFNLGTFSGRSINDLFNESLLFSSGMK